MTKIRMLFAAAACAGALVTFCGMAQAQVAPEELARRLVGEGIEAAKSRDWMTARDRFARAYEIQPIPLTLYNLAAAQEKTGRFVEADRSYRIFLRETSQGEYQKFRKFASSRRGELRKQIAYVVIRAPAITAGDVLELNQQEIAKAVLGESIPSNPGRVEVRVLRGGEVVATKTKLIKPGDSMIVEIAVPPPSLPEVSATAAPAVEETKTQAIVQQPEIEEEEEGGLLSSGVFWAVVAGVVVAGASVTAFVVMRPDDPFDSTLDRVDIVGR